MWNFTLVAELLPSLLAGLRIYIVIIIHCIVCVGVERDFVFYQEFLIPGASVGILECTHFSEWFGYNHTR